MGTIAQRTKGKAEEMTGAVEKAVGRLLGNERLEAEGTLLEVKGKARQKAAKAGERAKGTAEQVVGAVKNTVGRAVGNKSLELEGALQKVKGDARKAANQ